MNLTLPTEPQQRPVPRPLSSRLPGAHVHVMADIADRMQLGLHRYGALLQPFNGRSSARDAYEEVLDLAAYLRNLMDEHDALLPVIAAAFHLRERFNDMDLAHADPAMAALVTVVDALRSRGDIVLRSADGTFEVRMPGLEPVDTEPAGTEPAGVAR